MAAGPSTIEEQIKEITKCPPGASAPCDIDNTILFLNGILRYFAMAFWIAATFFVVYAGYLYLMSGGNEEKVKNANKQLIYAVIAIGVGILSITIIPLVNSLLGV